MKTFRITITMPDGSKDRCLGLFSDPFTAIIAIMDDFPQAKRISARRVP